MADLIDRTARQVRLYGRDTVHAANGKPFTTELGRAYRTRCGRTLYAEWEAMLTTRDVSCADCRKPSESVRALTESAERRSL